LFSDINSYTFYDHYKSSIDSLGRHHSDDYSKTRYGQFSLGVGIGIGKMREASPVFFVIRIIERLKDLQVFQRDLTKEEILDIVEIFARKMEYSVNYERFGKYFFGELLEMLVSKGVLKNTALTPYQTLYIFEVQQEQVHLRLFGWSVQVGGYITRNQREELSSDTSNPKRFLKQDVNSLQLKAQFGYPFSNNTHFFSSLIFDIPVSSKQKRVDVNATVQLSYELSERISTDLRMSYIRDNSFSYYTPSTYPEWFNYRTITLASWNFNFYIENNMSFYTRFQYSDSRNEQEINASTTMSQWLTPQISFGLNYRFF
ncbi:MAG: hypothetical protein AB1728_12220, partial [Bacteroidota bacterium]